MKSVRKCILGIVLTALLAQLCMMVSTLVPYHVVSGGVFALLLGMALHPVVKRTALFKDGIAFVSKQVLRLAIVLMGVTLSFSQVLQVGKFSLIVMVFTLLTAFGGGFVLGKLFHMEWRLSSLISAGTGICGGSAIAAIAPVIEAEDKFVAYALSATFLFDIAMVVLFPIMGRAFGMSDLGFGLWTGTAVNDTSSVVAAGYAFSDAAGAFSVIVKLTRTLAIIPTVLIFSLIQKHVKTKEMKKTAHKKVEISKIFPYFILMFLGVVAIKSTGMIPADVSSTIATVSKFCMVMALGAIGLKTDVRDVVKSGVLPMVHGLLISALVVIVSFLVQRLLGQI